MRSNTWVRHSFAFWALAAVCLLIIGPWACGKKAPPIPPKRPPLPQPMALEGWREGNRVRLSWRQGQSGQGICGYAVLRAQWPADQPPCDGCPLIFKEVGTLTVEPDVEQVEFTDLIGTDFVYSYKVQPIGSSGDRGPDSNRIVMAPEIGGAD
jgi:hypothetical protein